MQSNAEESPAARLYRDHAATVLGYLRLRLAPYEEAEDLLLEVFLAALEQGKRLEERSLEMQKAWLLNVARHKVADYYRRSKRRPQVALEQIAETLYADEALSPEQTTLDREEYEQMRDLVRRLPGLQQQVIYLRFVYDLRYSEIAEILGKKEGAVRKLLWRSLNLVRSLSSRK